MRQIWFKTLLGVFVTTGLGAAAFLSTGQAEAYQEAATPTGAFVTVTYSDPINVRGGPSTIAYPIVGKLNPGEVVPALGISPGHDWIKVSYSGGEGWVYASFVSLSGAELMVAEPPPTAIPPAASTVDPTMAAAFEVQPTPSRMPTFTPPPPLQVPHFDEQSTGRVFRPTGIFIVGLGLIGAIGLLASYILRK